MGRSISKGEGADDNYNQMFHELMQRIYADGPEKVSNEESKNNLKTIVGVFGAVAASFFMGVAVGVVYKSQGM
ncbi:transmembrane protein, putative [Medicago truncatula]|uniref:Transmembrane protein, putative n=1 Tax=Medicago truncatula TaxID=3880 RepID=G7L921_MEDTR|nr:transmembrane protein, putative [Medicago truncatula]